MVKKEERWFYDKRKRENLLNGLRSDDFVYRIFSLEWFLSLLDNKKITLMNFAKWKDPFENFILKAKAKTTKGKDIDFSNLSKKIYGQCWSLVEETDAMWRIYSKDEKVVKVKANVGRLFDSLYGDGESRALELYFGKVIYRSLDSIETLMKDHLKINKMLFQDTSGSGIIEYLLIKRLEFEHEHEARIIYYPSSNDPILTKNGNNDDMISFNIEPNEIIEKVTLDPRLDDDNFNDIKYQIKSKGYTGLIEKSTLYNPPSFNIILDV